jgi:hypothetical protein
MYGKRENGKPVKTIILTSACVFFFSFTALVLLVFFAGNFQGFTARSLFLLLDILEFSAFLCLASGAACLCWLILAAAGKLPFSPPQPRLREFALAVFCLLFGLGILALSRFILGLTLPKL